MISFHEWAARSGREALAVGPPRAQVRPWQSHSRPACPQAPGAHRLLRTTATLPAPDSPRSLLQEACFYRQEKPLPIIFAFDLNCLKKLIRHMFTMCFIQLSPECFLTI